VVWRGAGTRGRAQQSRQHESLSHVMLHVNRLDGLTIAVSQNEYLNPAHGLRFQECDKIRTDSITLSHAVAEPAFNAGLNERLCTI